MNLLRLLYVFSLILLNFDVYGQRSYSAQYVLVKGQKYSVPVLRGNYLACPNGKTVPKNAFSLSLREENDGSWIVPGVNEVGLGNRYQINGIKSKLKFNSEIIVGKKTADNYEKKVVVGFKKKMLEGSHNIPTSYKAVRVEHYLENGKPQFFKYWFRSSQGKEMLITRKSFGSTLQNHQGKVFKLNWSGVRTQLYCDTNRINLRIVREIRLNAVTNNYGELVKLPLMFWLVEIKVEAGRPSSANQISF